MKIFVFLTYPDKLGFNTRETPGQPRYLNLQNGRCMANGDSIMECPLFLLTQLLFVLLAFLLLLMVPGLTGLPGLATTSSVTSTTSAGTSTTSATTSATLMTSGWANPCNKEQECVNAITNPYILIINTRCVYYISAHKMLYNCITPSMTLEAAVLVEEQFRWEPKHLD